jgi:hypothetical protein
MVRGSPRGRSPWRRCLIVVMAEKTTSLRVVLSLVMDSRSTTTGAFPDVDVGATFVFSRLPPAARLGFTASDVAEEARFTAVRAGRADRRLVPLVEATGGSETVSDATAAGGTGAAVGAATGVIEGNDGGGGGMRSTGTTGGSESVCSASLDRGSVSG